MAGGTVRLDRAGGVVTDDRGVYRVFGLSAGAYIVTVQGVDQVTGAARQTTSAEVQWALQRSPAAVGSYSPPPASQTVAFAPVYFPGTLDPRSAAPVVVETGKEVAGVSFPIQFVPMVRVSGTLTRTDGRPAGGVSLQLQPEQPAGMQFGIAPRGARGSATARADGQFEFTAVAPGRYVLTTRLGTQEGILWSREYVDVAGQDLNGLSIVMKPAMTISGRVLIDSGATIDLLRVSLSLSSQPIAGVAGGSRASPGADGGFVLSGATAGMYSLTATPGPGQSSSSPNWTVKSATVGGRDVFDRYFEISNGGNIDDAIVTLTTRVANLSGKMLDAEGKAAPDFFVLLIPVDRSLWVERLQRAPKQARPANDGTYRFDAVPPGEYYLAASTDVDPRDLLNADFLEQFIPSAIKITIAEGEKKVQDLKIGG